MNHENLMANLPGKHLELNNLIAGRDVHFVDYPIHPNVGDILIMLGTLEFFRKSKVRPSICAPYYAYNENWANNDTVIVFQGGGNFGDLYRGPQQTRERVISKLKGNRIVILPQTIHFEDDDNLDSCARLFREHGDLHIFVRDRKSFEIAKTMTSNAYLVPDMAHHLWGSSITLGKVKCKKIGVLNFKRTDGEKGKDGFSYDRTLDWPELVGKEVSFSIRAFNFLIKKLHNFGLNKPLLRFEYSIWIFISKILVNKSVRIFSSANEVETDRLHGHILSCLLSLPNTISDNSYGKNSSYSKEWTVMSDLVKFK